MDVVISNLVSKVKSKIKVKRYIKKLAVYKDQIAVLLKDKLLVYQQTTEDEEEIIKSPKYSLKWEENVNLILLTTNHILICIDNRIQCYSITSNSELSEREWGFDGDIKYLKVLGGPVNRESLLCGVNTGEVFIINIDNQFPILIHNHEIPMKILDVSSGRKRLAIIDDNNDLSIIDIKSKETLYSNIKAKSVSFNSDLEDLVSYWYDGNVYLKTGDFPPTCEKMNGVIVGYISTKVFLLQGQNNVNILDTSQSTSIIRYAEKKEYEKAYQLATLGATKEEWLFLGFESLENMDLKTALACFKKLEDMRLINLIMNVEKDVNNQANLDIILGEIKCFKGDYNKAEELFLKGNCPDRAIEMWSMLTMFDKAMELKKKYGGKSDPLSDKLLLKQAEWLLENGKFLEAADLFWTLGRKKRAIEIYGDKGYLEKLIEILRTLNKDEHAELIALCGHYFKLHKHYPYATEAYLKLGDLKSLVMMNIELERWEEAFYLAKQSKPLLEYCHLQWAENRIKKDLYKEAQDSYKKAGRIDLSMKLLDNLIDNAIYEKRFKDASYLLFLYAQDAEVLIKNYTSKDKQDVMSVKLYQESLDLSEIINAYDIVYKYIEEPFSKDLLNTEPEWIYNSCKFLINKVSNYNFGLTHIKGVSLAYIYYASAFLAKQFTAYKTSRFSFEKLNTLQIPQLWRGKIEFEIMVVRAKPYTDNDSNMPLCFRCLTTNPSINILGDKCTICGNKFIRSSISYEILPLVEFFPDPSLEDKKARELISFTTGNKMQSTIVEATGANNEGIVYFNRGKNNNNQSINQSQPDLFESKLIEFCESSVGKEEYGKFIVDSEILKEIKESDVFIVDNVKNCATQPIKYFKNRMKDIFINMCNSCFRFFRNEEWENALAKNNNCCPFCKVPV